MKCGWSTNEEAVFVTDAGNILVYDMFGELKKNFSMGQARYSVSSSERTFHKSIFCTEWGIPSFARF